MKEINTTPKAEKEINYIPLVENFYFSASDDNNYTLYQFSRRKKIDRKTRKATDEIIESYDVMGYYGNLTNLIQATVGYLNRQSIINGNIATLKDCVNQIVSVTEQLTSMLE